MGKRTGKNIVVMVSMAALLALSMFAAQTAIADGEGDPVDAQFQSTGTIVLKQSLRGEDFMLLEDVTPLQVVGGHVAMKVPCDSNGDTPLQVLVGSASESGSALVAVELEHIADLSNPGRDCVYHADLDVEDIKNDLLIASGKEVNITDIALKNSVNRRIHFGFDNGNTVTVNLLTSSGEEEHHDD